MTSSSRGPRPRIRHLAAMWTLRGYPAGGEWSLDEKYRRVKAGGFEGVQGGIDPTAVRLAQNHGLQYMGAFDVDSIETAETRLTASKELGLFHINVQLLDHDTPTEAALPVTLRIMALGKELGINPHIEVHRDTCTETPEKTLALAQAFERETGELLKLNFDYSHPALIKHVQPGQFFEKLPERIDLLQNSDFIDLRPFNSQHCQIPVTDGHGNLSPEFEGWIPFAEQVFGFWLQKAKPGQELWEVPQLGAADSGYTISSFPDVWQDEIRARAEIDKAWQRAVAKWR